MSPSAVLRASVVLSLLLLAFAAPWLLLVGALILGRLILT